MVDGQTLIFRVLLDDAPRLADGWRPIGESARWDRHYLVKPGYSLMLAEGQRVQIHKFGERDGFRTEQLLADAAFPLDWMAISLTMDVLPVANRLLDIDGRDPQSFVDSLSRPDIAQVSILKVAKRYAHGPAVAEMTDFAIPGWSTLGVMLTLEASSPIAMRAHLAALGLLDHTHVEFADYLAAVHEERLPEPKQERRFGLPFPWTDGRRAA